MNSPETSVRYEREGYVGILTLDRGDGLNRMSPELLDDFEGAVDAEQRDSQIRCLLIRARGRCFCAGADLRGPLQREPRPGAESPAERSYGMYRPFLRVLDIEVPTLAALNGAAVGGGLGLALVCDLRIASTEARLGANFVRLGLHPGMALTYLLPLLAGVSRASDLLYSARLVDAEEALQMGLVNRVVASDALEHEALQWAHSIAANAAQALRATKRSLRRFVPAELKEWAFLEASAQAESLQSSEAKEGVAAQLEGRKAHFP